MASTRPNLFNTSGPEMDPKIQEIILYGASRLRALVATTAQNPESRWWENLYTAEEVSNHMVFTSGVFHVPLATHIVVCRYGRGHGLLNRHSRHCQGIGRPTLPGRRSEPSSRDRQGISIGPGCRRRRGGPGRGHNRLSQSLVDGTNRGMRPFFEL